MGRGVVVLSSDHSERVSKLLGVECLTIDAMTLRSVIRSRVGVVVLSHGVIERKCDIRDI